jgi:hypothetical protein
MLVFFYFLAFLLQLKYFASYYLNSNNNGAQTQERRYAEEQVSRCFFTWYVFITEPLFNLIFKLLSQ